MWGLANSNPNVLSYLAAFDLEFPEDIEYQKTVISEGLDLFEKLHGYKASFLVPPNGPFNNQLEDSAFKKGICYISTSKIHQEPQGNGKFKTKYCWLGKENKYGQRFITRNAYFEPSQGGKNWVDSCLNDIETAFTWHKPVTISTHRVNYIGAIASSNRENGLKQLKELLQTIVRKWPDVEFMTSAELGNLISFDK